MDFRLQVFKKVATKLNFTKAAEELFISQPAVSKHIKELEIEYNIKLFDREKGKIVLTPEGKVFLNYANQIISLYRNMESYFLSLNNNLEKEIVFGASTTISQYIIPKILPLLQESFSKSKFSLVSGNSTKIEELLLNKEIDFGLVEGTHNHPLLTYDFFMRDEIVLLTKSNPNQSHPEVDLQKLKNFPLIFREKGSGTRKIIEDVLLEKQTPLNTFINITTLGSTESIKTYLLNSNSYAFISIHAVEEALKSNLLQIIDVENLEISREFYLVTTQGYTSASYKIIKKFLIDNYN